MTESPQTLGQLNTKSGVSTARQDLSHVGSSSCCPGKKGEISKIQTKLTIGPSNDDYEQEADRVAEQVMRMPDSWVKREPNHLDMGIKIRRVTDHGSGGRNIGPDIQFNQSGGHPLSDSTRKFMEPRFGVSFGHVRLHADKNAHQMASQIHAKAFTYRNRIWLGSGESESNKNLMAHELAHVVQQTHNKKFLKIQRFTVDDCSEEHGNELRSAYVNAQVSIPRVVSKILNPSEDERRTFETYFGTTNSAPYIGLRLYLIRHGLQRATAECETPDSFMYNHFCGGSLAYVRPVPAFFGFGNIHICQPGYHNLTENQQTATLVHEGAHRYLDADDEAYYTLNCAETAETRGLSDRDRWDNADSYGCLVQELS